MDISVTYHAQKQSTLARICHRIATLLNIYFYVIWNNAVITLLSNECTQIVAQRDTHKNGWQIAQK